MKSCLACLLLVWAAVRAHAASPQPKAAAPRQATRHIQFNQRELSEQELRVIEQLEAAYRFRLPDGHYWYDPVSGALGIWGGPTAGFLPAGLSLGGKLAANASGGGTGVFVNGRELHPMDMWALSQLGPVLRGRWFVDRYGNVGAEGGPVLFNLYAAARAARSRGSGSGGAWSHTFSDGAGGNNYVGGDSSFGYVMTKNGTFYYDK